MTETLERGEQVRHAGVIMQVRSRNADGTYTLVGMSGNPLLASVRFADIERKVNGVFPPIKPPIKPTAPTRSVKPDAIIEGSQTGLLNASEQSDLDRHERVIEAGLNTYIEVGTALLDIRQRRLYRQQHKTFEAYCQKRWGMSRSYASRQITAAEIVTNLLPIGNKIALDGYSLPVNEAQARALATVPADQQAEVWREAVDTASSGKVTAKHVRSVASKRAVVVPEAQPDPPDGDEPASDNEESLAGSIEEIPWEVVRAGVTEAPRDIHQLRERCLAIIEGLSDEQVLIAHQILTGMT